jgi:hypothetical protein
MSSARPVTDIQAALARREFPSITTWNRVEGRPRTINFDRALRAELRDPLWMLTKQWQMGEFRGSDAGSPVFAKVQIDTTRLTKYQPAGQAPEPFEYDVPFEAKVERRPLLLTSGGRVMSLDLRLAMGRYWLKLIGSLNPVYRQAFIDAYPVTAPDPTRAADADQCATPTEWATFAAFAGRAMDGGVLYEHLTAAAGNHAYDGVAGIAGTDQTAIDSDATRFTAWVQRMIMQPPVSGDDAWVPGQLEYQFAASAPDGSGGERVYTAQEYYQGALDWYSLDRDATASPLGAVAGSDDTGLPPAAPMSTIPVPVSFAGMPNTRWWTFEDSHTDFGDIDAATTDLAKLLFIEFALVYSNDWFVIPQTLPLGTIGTVAGVAVTNTFGERFWISAADSGADADWRRWSMFTINVTGQTAADPSLVLLPTSAKVQHSQPTEQVMMIRDEVADMVWGIEQTIPLPTGATERGIEAARGTLAYLQGLVPGGAASTAPAAKAAIRYEVMTTVPENWIPFLPVHVTGSDRQTQLQRAAMPRILDGDPNPPAKVQPRTRLMRQGLDDTPPAPYYINQEEVPRAGTQLVERWERTRWTDGSVYTWLRVQRQTGRGEGSSGLAFDQLVDLPFTPPAS